MSPIAGISGLGGGISALTFHEEVAGGIWYGDRGLIASGSDSNAIDYFSISSPSNGSDFET